MVDWEAAATVAISGLLSVFAVLAALMITVQFTGKIIDSQVQKKRQKQST